MAVQSLGGVGAVQMQAVFDYHDASEPTSPQTVGVTITGPETRLIITGTILSSGFQTPQGQAIPPGSSILLDCVAGVEQEASSPGGPWHTITSQMGNICNIGRVVLFGPGSVLGNRYSAAVPQASIPQPVKGQPGAIDWSTDYQP